jgi:hypothetical protein
MPSVVASPILLMESAISAHLLGNFTTRSAQGRAMSVNHLRATAVGIRLPLTLTELKPAERPATKSQLLW